MSLEVLECKEAFRKLICENCGKKFGKEPVAYISLNSIRPREAICVVGPNVHMRCVNEFILKELKK